MVVGLYLCAMGLGAWASRFVTGDPLETFVRVELWTGLVGGLSSLLCFAVGAAAPAAFLPVFVVVLVAVGAAVGVEIPLLVRILREQPQHEHAVSDTLALDYVGSLVGSLLLPLVVLPALGPPRASLAFGLINLGVAWAGASLLPDPRPWRRGAVLCALVLCFAMVGAGGWGRWLEDRLYADAVIHAESSKHQRIVLTRWRDDLRLYLNGALQFSSIDERRYHEPLVVPGLTLARPRTVLVLGGGDGLAVRLLLQAPTVERITVVDLDPSMTQLASTHPALVRLNGGAFQDPRVQVVHEDAMAFLEHDRGFWDLVVSDLPDPNTDGLARLYSSAFAALALRRLSQEGVFVTQATSPFFAPEAFWCIVHTLEDVAMPSGFTTMPYHASVPSFGEWGWVLVGRGVSVDGLHAIPIPTRFLDAPTLRSLFLFPADLQPPADRQTEHLHAPRLSALYRGGFRQFRGDAP